jgi:hypothetical protein
MTIELRLPLTAAPTGFAFAYLTGDAQDCNGDFVGDPLNFKWPPLVPTPSATAPGLQDPSVWGDLGRRAPLVAFQPPTCCHSADIAFTQNGAINPQPFTAGVPVDITARVHNSDTAFDAKNVKVRVVVHDFGSGGVDVFDTALPALPDDPVIGTIGTATSASTSPVTWPAPPAGMHGCIRTFLLPPGVGAGTSLDDYSVGAEASAQHNTDVACVGAGGNKQMMFKAFNPDDQDRKVVLVMQQRLPEAMKGLKLELLQPDRPLRPREVFQAALKLTAPAGLPATDLPHQAAHVPPTAGGPTGGDVAAPAAALVQVPVQPGARVHVMASGQVDTDGDGSAPPTGPDGRDAGPQAEGRVPALRRRRPHRRRRVDRVVRRLRHQLLRRRAVDVHGAREGPGPVARRQRRRRPPRRQHGRGLRRARDDRRAGRRCPSRGGRGARSARRGGRVRHHDGGGHAGRTRVPDRPDPGRRHVPGVGHGRRGRAHRSPVEPGKKPWWLLLLLLVIVAVGALFLRKKSASA